jgi:hypothetical protein
MKTAYEIALERLGQNGIAPPDNEALSQEVRGAMAEIRRKAKATLAELEILHRDRVTKIRDPQQAREEEENYRRERRRIEEKRDRDIDRLRRKV